MKGKVQSVRTIHCVLHKNHLVAKNFISELYAALKVCIRSVYIIKLHPQSSRLLEMLCKKITRRITNSFHIRKQGGCREVIPCKDSLTFATPLLNFSRMWMGHCVTKK